MEKRIYYLSNTVITNTKRERNIHVSNVLTQVGVKQLTDFLCTVTAVHTNTGKHHIPESTFNYQKALRKICAR